MTPTPTAKATEPFVGPFHVEGPSATATWRVLDDNFQFVSREFFDPAPAQFICNRLNASIPQAAQDVSVDPEQRVIDACSAFGKYQSTWRKCRAPEESLYGPILLRETPNPDQIFAAGFQAGAASASSPARQMSEGDAK